MAANNEPVCLRGLATVMKYGPPNIKLSEALVLASELKHVIDCNSIQWKPAEYIYLLQFSEEAISHGLRSPGTTEEKIQAVLDYQQSHSLPVRNNPEFQQIPIATSPKRIVKQLQAALEGKTNFIKAAESMDDHEVSTVSPDVELLAARTFMYRNGHDGVSDEDAVQAFHKAVQYQNGEQHTSADFLKPKGTDLIETIKCVNMHLIEESIDIIGLKLVQNAKSKLNPDTELPKSNQWDICKWEVFPLSEVDKYRHRDFLSENRSDDNIIAQWGHEQGQNYCRWYIFCFQGEDGRTGYYAMQFTKTITINGIVTDIKNMVQQNNSAPLDVLKLFQAGKENRLVDCMFQKCDEYLWGRDGKPPALPYSLVAQLYWPQFVQNVQDQPKVTDKEALTLVYDEVTTLAKENEESSLKTYTWFLNKPGNVESTVPELRSYVVGQAFTDYLYPSTEPVKPSEDFYYEWSRENHKIDHRDFTLIYRARPTLERVPQTILERNRIRFDYWQYIKEFIFFGGSWDEGTVLAPDPDWIDQAHSNGVAIFGTVFLAPVQYGGQPEDIEELSKEETLKKLVDIAQRLNFEGWFLNVESYGTYRNPSLEKLKWSLENTNLGGKTFIYYLPLRAQSDKYKPANGRAASDAIISNLSDAFLEEGKNVLRLNSPRLMAEDCQPPREYLMFVDEPFWKIKLKRKGYLVNPFRLSSAENCHWQFFLGENGLEREATSGWNGIAEYAKERKQMK